MLKRSSAAIVAALCLSATPALAQDQAPAAGAAAPAAPAEAETGGIVFELNNMTQADADCLVTFLTRNETGKPIDALGVQVFVFDQEERVTGNPLTLRLGALGPGKTTVKRYVFENLACESVSSILVNEVSECTGEGLDAGACLDALRTSTRVDAALKL